jgi:hypothetical protein
LAAKHGPPFAKSSISSVSVRKCSRFISVSPLADFCVAQGETVCLPGPGNMKLFRHEVFFACSMWLHAVFTDEV